MGKVCCIWLSLAALSSGLVSGCQWAKLLGLQRHSPYVPLRGPYFASISQLMTSCLLVSSLVASFLFAVLLFWSVISFPVSFLVSFSVLFSVSLFWFDISFFVSFPVSLFWFDMSFLVLFSDSLFRLHYNVVCTFHHSVLSKWVGVSVGCSCPGHVANPSESSTSA